MKKVLVGMSGGVDSAMAVYLLKQQGYDVRGVFLEMIDNNDFKNAQETAKQLSIKLIVLSFISIILFYLTMTSRSTFTIV